MVRIPLKERTRVSGVMAEMSRSTMRLGFRGRHRDLHLADFDAMPGLLQIPAAFAAWMLLVRDEDFVARFEIEAGGDGTHGLRRTVHDGEFVFLTPREVRQRFSMFVEGFVAPPWIFVFGERGGALHVVGYGLNDRLRGHTQASVIEVSSPIR